MLRNGKSLFRSTTVALLPNELFDKIFLSINIIKNLSKPCLLFIVDRETNITPSSRSRSSQVSTADTSCSASRCESARGLGVGSDLPAVFDLAGDVR